MTYETLADEPAQPMPNGRDTTLPLKARFRWLVQSPLRAGLLRHLHRRPEQAFEMSALMQAFGRIRQDVETCLQELVAMRVAERLPGLRPRHRARQPDDVGLARVLREFLADPPALMPEDLLASVRAFHDLIGEDEKMLVAFESIRMAAKTDLTVLIVGPPGCGKQLAARAIHELSRRRLGPMHVTHCRSLSDDRLEVEAAAANRGTLFLDEVGTLSSCAQTRLLRLINERRGDPEGPRSTDADLRLICSTSRSLDLLVAERSFSEALASHINAFSIRLPSLSERPADIAILAGRLLARACAARQLPPETLQLSSAAIDRLVAHSWPGNLDELEATMARAALRAPGTTVGADDIEFQHDGPETEVQRAFPPLRDVERDHIQLVLDSVDWNKKKAARVLQISRETLYRKIADYHLSPAIPAVDGRVPDGQHPDA